MRLSDEELSDRFRAWLGTATMVVASSFAVLIFCDRMRMDFLPLPATWHSSRQLHLVICGGLFLAAAVLLKSPLHRESARIGVPLFRTCRFFTRASCSLCDEALATLLRYQEALPGIEIIDIDDDEQLLRQFGESVPVVELDGKVRFRGAVSRPLLERLIHAAELRAQTAGDSSAESGASDSGVLADTVRRRLE